MGVRMMLEFEVFVVNVVAVLIGASLRFILIVFSIKLVPEEAKLVESVFFDLLIVDKNGLIGDFRPTDSLRRN